MGSYKWKRCQRCGGEAKRTVDSDRTVRVKYRVWCSRCGRMLPIEDWDHVQAGIRADKRFELVKATYSSQNDWHPKITVEIADSQLTEIYGPEPKEEG